MKTAPQSRRVLNDATIAQLRQIRIRNLRRTIAKPNKGRQLRQHHYARAVEEAVLQALQEDMQRARRHQALIAHHGTQILAQAFGIKCETAGQAAYHLDQIAEEAMTQDSRARQDKAKRTCIPHQTIDIGRDFPLLDLDLSAIRTIEEHTRNED